MATCSPCNSSAVTTYDVQYFYSNQCFDCSSDCGSNISNSHCVVYTGPNLSCSGIVTNDSIETALQKIDEQICSAIGDYSTYQFHCLTDFYGQPITTEEEFVDAVSSYACATQTNLNTFISDTYGDFLTANDTRINAVEVPAITCASAAVVVEDTLVEVLTKYCSKFTAIDASLSLAGVDWDQCLASSTPSTIAAAFSLLLEQICLLRTEIYATTTTTTTLP